MGDKDSMVKDTYFYLCLERCGIRYIASGDCNCW